MSGSGPEQAQVAVGPLVLVSVVLQNLHHGFMVRVHRKEIHEISQGLRFISRGVTQHGEIRRCTYPARAVQPV